MNFSERMGTVNKNSIFSLEDEGYIVWCGTMTKGDDGLYYLYFSFWDKELGHNAWVTSSKIGYAVSESPYGGFKYKGLAFGGAGKDVWDRDCVHNPAVLKHNGKYYMYYMGNYGNGEYWDHRNHQKIGIAVADSPEGPWKRRDTPLIETGESGFDSLMVSNPSVTKGPDGKFYMIYKAVEDNGIYPKGGSVVCGMAVSDAPDGEFKKCNVPIMTNPENEWSVEDAFIWCENNKFYSLAKDFQGYFTGLGKGHVALFESENGMDWELSKNNIGFKKEITWENGKTEKLSFMERPQIYMENNVPKVLLCACVWENDTEREHSFNIAIPLK